MILKTTEASKYLGEGGNKMVPNRYAVVKQGINMTFNKWHETYEEAKVEAERLCRKERVPFSVIREASYCYVEEAPIKWEGVRDESRNQKQV